VKFAGLQPAPREALELEALRMEFHPRTASLDLISLLTVNLCERVSLLRASSRAGDSLRSTNASILFRR